jgi:hypothetical protein
VESIDRIGSRQQTADSRQQTADNQHRQSNPDTAGLRHTGIQAYRHAGIQTYKHRLTHPLHLHH